MSRSGAGKGSGRSITASTALNIAAVAPIPTARVATIATVNDVHFGETVCGIMDGIPDGPFFSVEPGAEPYPEVMNRGAIAEISALDPDAVVVKGDLTNDGLDEEYAAFLAAYQPAFGDRLHHVRGNHDAYRHQTYAPEGPQRIDVDGLTIALLDTTIPGHTTGQVPDEQLEWLEDLAAEADRIARERRDDTTA